MSDIIHLLPDSVANQIAAGEVIQRPASVLKELVENAIDAGATYVQIAIKDAGRTLIQVVDNGKGMSETDARMAFERHATSKIKDAADIFSLRTMGFRGEALASIAAVAQVELRTRRAEDELGTLVEIAGTRVFKQESVQCDRGTAFQIKNLFFNVPARRRFLKSDNVEKNHLLNEFYRIALVYPQIEFSFRDGDEEIFRLPVSNSKIRIENLFGKNSKKRLQQQLLTIETTTQLVSIHGYIGKPEFAQKSAHQYFFVNGRYMRHPYFHKAVIMAYNQMLQPNEGPHYFIYFEVEPDTIDINIHPTKTEIKFENEQSIWSILSASIKEALGKFNITPSIDFDREGAIDIPVTGSLENVRPPQTNFNPNYNPFSASSGSSYKRPTMDWEKLYGGFETGSEVAPSHFEEEEMPEQPFSRIVEVEIESIPEQQSIEVEETRSENFQLKNRYIITSIKSGMLMIDQHRAHIRILYNEFLREIEHRKGFSQQVLFPETLELNTNDLPYFQNLQENFKHLGFVFERTDDFHFDVKGVPSQLGNESAVALLKDIIHKTQETEQESVSAIHELIAATLAESTAIKSGQKLTNAEMNDLIERLFSCPDHNYTPDGKPVMTIWTQEEIQAKFR